MNSAFFTQIGQIGAQVETSIGAGLGCQVGYIHRGQILQQTNTIYDCISGSLTSNVVTLTFEDPHGLSVGQIITANLSPADFNATNVAVASVPTTTTLTYALTASNVSLEDVYGPVTWQGPAALTAFLGKTVVTKELVIRIMTAGERINFNIPLQPTVSPIFPPSDDVALFDQVLWTPPVTGVQLSMTVEDWVNHGSFGTMYRLQCWFPNARQGGAVGPG